jgi:hypothetical protein
MYQVSIDDKTIDYCNIFLWMFYDLTKIREKNPNKYIVKICDPLYSIFDQHNSDKIQSYVNATKTVVSQKQLIFDEPYGMQRFHPKKACVVFDQIKYQKKISRIRSNRRRLGLCNTYDQLVIEECLKPLYYSGLIDLIILLPNYQISSDICSEIDVAEKFGVHCRPWQQLTFSL